MYDKIVAIHHLVADAFGIKREEIFTRHRHRDTVEAKCAATYICRQSLGVSFNKMSTMFGDKSGSLFNYRYARAKELLEIDKDFAAKVNQIMSGETLSRQARLKNFIATWSRRIKGDPAVFITQLQAL